MNLPREGDQFIVIRLEPTTGILVASKFLRARKLGQVTYKGWFPGHGGDVWACEHPNGKVGAYSFTELVPFSDTLAQKINRMEKYQRKVRNTKSKPARKRLANRARKYANSIQ